MADESPADKPLLSDDGKAKSDNRRGCLGSNTPLWIKICLIVFVSVILVAGIVIAVGLAYHATYDIVLPPIHDYIQQVGRWDTRNESGPQFKWSGSGFRVAIQGSKFAAVRFSHNCTSPQPIRYWIDGETNVTFIDKSEEVILEFSDRISVHLLQIAKKSEVEYKEQFGPIAFEGIRVEHAGRYVSLDRTKTTKKRVLEVIGDSLTCGFGLLGGPEDAFDLSTEDPTLTYAWKIADYLDAVPNLVPWSGIGVDCNRNWANRGHEMPHIYPYLFGNFSNDEPLYNFTLKPDGVMIFLGSNDDSCSGLDRNEFKQNYTKFWNYLLEKVYPDLTDLQVIIGCGTAVTGYEDGVCNTTTICQQVQEAVSAANNPRVHFVPIFSYGTKDICDSSILGCRGHPNEQGHKYMYQSAVQKVASYLGWDESIKARPSKNVFGTWGRITNQSYLEDYCGSDKLIDEYTMIMIDGVRKLDSNASYSILDIDKSFCDGNFSEKGKGELLKCEKVGDHINSCLGHSVKILLTLGGLDGLKKGAEDFADELWNTYFGGRNDAFPRPFGDVNLSGINIDIDMQGYDQDFYSSVVQSLIEKSGEKEFVVAVTINNTYHSISSLCNISSSMLLLRCTPEELESDDFKTYTEFWLSHANSTQSHAGILVPRRTTKMSKIDEALEVISQINIEKQYHLFDGVAFDEVEPKSLSLGTARVVNSMFKDIN